MKNIEKYVSTIQKIAFLQKFFKKIGVYLPEYDSSLEIDFPIIYIIVSTSSKKSAIK